MTQPADAAIKDLAPEPTAEQAAMIARVRRMMLIAGLTTALGVGALLVVIGYRLFRSDGSTVTAATTATLPKGAKILSTGAAGDRIVLTIEVSGTIEIRTFDAKSLKSTGTLKFASEP